MPTLEGALLSHGLVTREQIQDAERLDAGLRGGIGLNLVRLGYLTEDALVDLLRKSVPGVPVADQTSLSKASSFALGLVPLSLVERHRAVPVMLQGSTLSLAMANPLDAEAVGEIERHTRCKVAPLVAAESAISWALLRYFGLLTPAYSGAATGDRAAASVSIGHADPEAGAAIPLTRRRRAPLGDSPEDLDQIPVDLPASTRKSLPPSTQPQVDRVEEALARLERQKQKTSPEVVLPAAGRIRTPTQPLSGPAAPPRPSEPAGPPPAVPEPRDAPARHPPAHITLTPPPMPTAAAPGAIVPKAPFVITARVAAAPPVSPPAAAPPPAAVPPPPHPPRPPAEAQADAAGRKPAGETLPFPVIPSPVAPRTAAAAEAVEAIRAAAAAAEAPARETPPADMGPRKATPRMGIPTPYLPARASQPTSTASLGHALDAIKEGLRRIDDRDRVVELALNAAEEAFGPAAFLARREGGYGVHQAGPRFVAMFGDATSTVRPGQDPVLERGFSSQDPLIGPSPGVSPVLRTKAGARLPDRSVAIPIQVLGRTVGVFLALADRPADSLATDLPACRALATAVGERLLAIIKKKKGK